MKNYVLPSHSLAYTTVLLIPFVLPLGLALDLYLPSIPTMLETLQATSVEIQLTMSIFLYSYGLGQLFIGPLSDSFGRRNIMLASLALFTTGSIICACAQELTSLLGGRVLQALGASGSQVVTLAIVKDQFEGKIATSIFTSLKAAMGIAPICAPILGAYVQVHYGWQANFIFLGLYGAASFILASRYVGKTNKTLLPLSFVAHFLHPYKNHFKNMHFLYYCCCAIASQAAMFGYFSLSPRYYITHFGLNEAEFALLFSINACAFLITGLAVGSIIYKIGFKKSTLVAALLMLGSGLLMSCAQYFFEHHYVLFIPNLIASSAAALMLGASTSGALLPFKTHLGAAAALFGCLEFIGGGLIGSLSIIGSSISVMPLAGCLILMGFIIVVLNQFLTQP